MELELISVVETLLILLSLKKAMVGLDVWVRLCCKGRVMVVALMTQLHDAGQALNSLSLLLFSLTQAHTHTCVCVLCI